MGGIKNDMARAFKSTQIFAVRHVYRAFIGANSSGFDVVVGFGLGRIRLITEVIAK